MIHLDTSFLVRALLAGSPQDRMLREWLHRGERLGISSIGWAEFLCGPLEPDQLELASSLLHPPEAFEAGDAEMAARLFNAAGGRRGTLGDCMIAATAIRSEAMLATATPRDFRRFETAGLEVLAA
jgi:predicted nucleic acid-binding protein